LLPPSSCFVPWFWCGESVAVRPRIRSQRLPQT